MLVVELKIPDVLTLNRRVVVHDVIQVEQTPVETKRSGVEQTSGDSDGSCDDTDVSEVERFSLDHASSLALAELHPVLYSGRRLGDDE
jgi:hypothetical protein